MNFERLTETLPAWSLREVTLRVAQPEEIAAVCAVLDREHYLGAPKPCNREVVQLATRGKQVLAVVVWTRAARKLAGREAWIDWDRRTRTRRLALVVQNNRFLVLAAARQPNLASRVLGLAVAALPADWEKRTGTRPLLAETFVDPERYAGTCYKAAGWIELGETAGCGRHGDDYYVAHGQPKRLWLRPFEPEARERLREPLDPIAGETQRAFGELPVPAKTAQSLADALREVVDPRRAAGRQFPLHAMLASAVLALSCGARTVSDLFRFVQELTPAQRPRQSLAGASARRGLLAQSAQGAPTSGTDSRRRRLATGANPPAPAPRHRRQDAASRARHPRHALIAALPPGTLDGAIVGGDALYADPALVRPLVQDQGAIALVQLKDNQPKAAERAEALLIREAPPFFRLRSKSATAASISATSAPSPSPRKNSASSTPPNCSKSSATACANPPAWPPLAGASSS